MAQKSCSNCGGRVVGSKPDKGTAAADLCTTCIKQNLREGTNPFDQVIEASKDTEETETALVDA